MGESKSIKTNRVNICVPDDLLAQLKAEAKLSGLAISDIIRQAVKMYLKDVRG